MFRKSMILAAVMTGVLVSILFADTMPNLPLLTARKIPAGLSDVRTREFIRQLPPVVPELWRFPDEGIPNELTSLKIAYDAENIYIACTCMESKMSSISDVVTKHDGPCFADDSIEFFFDTLHNRKTYFHVAGSISGALFEERDSPNGGSNWDGPWSTEVEKEADRWNILMIVPFKSMEATEPKPGTLWGGQIRRNEIPHTESSQWSPTTWSLHMPELYGDILFGGKDALIASTLARRLSAPEENLVSIALSNPSTEKRELESIVESDGKQIISKYTCPSGVSQWGLRIDAPKSPSHAASLVIREVATDRVVMRTFLTADIKDHRQSLEKCEEAFKRTVPRTDTARRAKTEVAALISSTSKFAATGKDTQVKWDRLGVLVADVRIKLTRLRCLCADKQGYGYALGTELPIRKIFRDKDFEGQIGGKAIISASRNEFESVQVVVLPYNRLLNDVTVGVTSLLGPNGASIPSSSIGITRVEYIEARTPCYVPSTTGWHPDPLMNFDTFSCPVGQIQPLWVTVHTPKEIPAGTYRGKLTVKPSNASAMSMDLEVHVWNFDMPDQMHMKTAFAFGEGDVTAWYGKKMNTEQRREWYSFLLDHHINPTNIYDSNTVPTLIDIPFCVAHGMNSFNLAHTTNMDDKALADYTAQLRPYETLLKKNGWWDKTYIYGFDEVSPGDYPILQAAYSQVKKAFPDLPRMCTVVPNSDLKGYVDIWVPITSNFKPDVADEYTKAGDQVWWYVCCSPLHPYANFFVDYPAVEPRLLSWMNWKYHVPGLLYYDIAMWWTNISVDGLPNYLSPHQDAEVRKLMKEGKRWPEIPWNSFTYGRYNGDGQLIYPGPGMKPLSSIRLEAIRDGIDDYEYMYILSDLVKTAEKNRTRIDPKTLAHAKELLAVRPELVKSMTEYTTDPEAVMSTRTEIAQMIEELKGLKH